ncbi:hypothetical protein CG716_17435 [Mycolicibacterium sphagni]|uniref:Uncharacterized protein n=1 Tax=Mycolicibacterium sphagni TaxID=1786 RepID=A0A255DE57_9MYCO|nr:hypothetical protein CG716_17435 [Mycolicibacterium sphagni]
MSKTGRTNPRRGSRGTPKPERHITVRSVRREQPDLRKLSRAVIAMALREAEAKTEVREALLRPGVQQSTTQTDTEEAASA